MMSMASAATDRGGFTAAALPVRSASDPAVAPLISLASAVTGAPLDAIAQSGGGSLSEVARLVTLEMGAELRESRAERDKERSSTSAA
jgi:hypothetical protein